MILTDLESLNLQADRLGGKARRLIELKNHGFSIPSFFVVTPGDFTTEALTAALRSLPGNAFAVRSSAGLEDGENFSFAGQFSSFLDRRSADDVAAAVTAVRASAHSPAALEYQRQREISLDLPTMNVIVQEMATAEFSGVLFTADPTTGDHGVALLSFAKGLGDAVVDGQANCIEVRVDLKDWSVRYLGAGSTAALPNEEIVKIVRTGLKIAEVYQCPQDIEWCWSGSRLQIVQTRPITSENIQRRLGHETAVFDNSNIQESFCGVTLPLTFSFASYAYHQVYRQLMRVAGFSEREVAQHDHRHRNMLSYINGHVFYNIQSWYDGLRLLPAFHRNKEDMEKMMGVEHPVDFVRTEKLTIVEKIQVLPKLFRAIAFLVWSFARIDSLYLRFVTGFDRKLQEFDRRNIYRLSPLETLKKVKAAKVGFLSDWSTPIINDFFVMVYGGKVRRSLKKIQMEGDLSALLAGEDLASTAPTKALMKMAAKLRKDRELVGWFLQQTEGREILAALRWRRPEMASEFDSYIEKYGDRVVGELKLESEALWQNPNFMFDVLRSMVGTVTDPANLVAKEQQLRRQAESRVFARLPGRRFRRDLQRLRKGVRLREDMRLKRTQAFGLFRRLYSHLGETLARQGVLTSGRDVFYLTESEIEAFLETRSVHRDLKPLIEIRRRDFSEFAATEPPSHFRSKIPFYNQTQLITPATDSKPLTGAKWQGIGCYPGLVHAQVVVLREPTRNLVLAGKILCTMRTDPGWAPLFPNLAGLLVERGSTLSHSAIIARELGIPTVVGARGVTAEIKTGDWLQLNGLTGEVQILKTPVKTEVQREVAAFVN